MRGLLASVVAAVLLVAIAACGGHDAASTATHDAHAGRHVHHAPHEGTLVVLEEEAFHVEVVLDAGSGTIHAYVLDAHAENAVRIAQPSIALHVRTDKGEYDAGLAAVASELSGEKVGDTSAFEGRIDALKGQSRFEGRFGRIELKGLVFDQVAFPFPEGNDAEHAEDPGVKTK